MDLKNIASRAFSAPALVQTAVTPTNPTPLTPANSAASASAPSTPADATSIKATGSRSTIGLMQAARDQVVGDFRGMFGDVVRSNVRLESANKALGTALESGDPAAIRKAGEDLKSALGDLQKQLQRLPGEVAKMKTLPPGVKDVYVPHLQEIQRIAESVTNIGAGTKSASGVQAGGGQAAVSADQAPAAAASSEKAQAPAEPAKVNDEVKGDRQLERREKRFKKLDKDGDGVLSADELKGRQRLLRRDADGDGTISREEFMKGPVKRAEAPKAGGGAPAPANPAPAATSAAPAAAAGALPPAEQAIEGQFKDLLAGFEKMQQAAASGNIQDFMTARDAVVKGKQAILDGTKALTPERQAELQGKLQPILEMLKPLGL